MIVFVLIVSLLRRHEVSCGVVFVESVRMCEPGSDLSEVFRGVVTILKRIIDIVPKHVHVWQWLCCGLAFIWIVRVRCLL